MFPILVFVAFMVLLVTFFVVKSQRIQKDLKVQRRHIKSLESQLKSSLSSTTSIVNELQQLLLSRLEDAKRRNLVGGERYETTKTLYQNMDRVVLQCCEKGFTVAEAAGKTFAKSSPDIEGIKVFISEQPDDVKLQWSRNTVNHFISALIKIIEAIDKPEVAKEPQEIAAVATKDQASG